MTGPWCDDAMLAGLERSVVLCLEASTALLGATRDALTPRTPPKVLRACLASVCATQRIADGVVARRPVATPDDDPPDVVRADAELRAQYRALCEQAAALEAELTRRLRTPRARRGAGLARIARRS